MKIVKTTTFSPLQVSSVPSKPMESQNIMTFPVHLWTGINQSDIPALRVVDNFYPLFHSDCTRWFAPGFHQINRVYCRHYCKRNNLTRLLWACFWGKMLIKLSSKILWILIVKYRLGHILKLLFRFLSLFLVLPMYKS